MMFAKEAVAKYRPDTVDLQHVLAVLLGGRITAELCGRLSAKGLKELEKLSVSELQELGLTKNQCVRLQAAFVFARKWADFQVRKTSIKSSKAAYEYLAGKLAHLTQEHFYLLCLDTKNHILHERTVFVGSLNATVVHPRELFREAIKYSAASIIVGHNHPSGDPTPSKEDIEVTKRLREVGRLVGIELLDHLVIGQGCYTSLKERGYV